MIWMRCEHEVAWVSSFLGSRSSAVSAKYYDA